ncbi:serine/threonine-protein phosphatase 4 regulatory subunit 1-like isoform X3 [Venturia canescens]|nr:serine/threonine-protein phosphatase 4 regulatory subunit 1-like isoform X3 [Venturia canescens]
MEDTNEPMEGADDGETGGDGPADGRGDEGGGESLPPMTKLQQHASCNTRYNRQLVGRILVEVFRGAVETGTELNVDEVMQPVLKLVNDTDPTVRIDLIEQLPHVAMICQEAPDRLGDVLPRHLIQIISTFLLDDEQQVRQSTHSALLALIDRGLLDKNSAEFVVAPTLLRMTQQLDRLELFTLAIDGMSKVAKILDEATAERLFLNRYLALCAERNFFIRRLCGFRFGEFSASMSKDAVYEKLLPMYVTLCKDPVWSVRKSCADVIVSFACCVSLHHRRTTLSEQLANFLTDDSKWVRVSAFQILGPFISTFAKQFTGFSYNEYGELVLTDQHGTELRYNVKSSSGGSTEPAFCNAMITTENALYAEFGNLMAKSCAESGGEGDYTKKANMMQDDRVNAKWKHEGASKSSVVNDENQENDATIVQDYDEFNPFRYYYIPPNLPLDTELVQAAMVESSTEKSQISPTKEETQCDANGENKEFKQHRGRRRRLTVMDKLVLEKSSRFLKNCIECNGNETRTETLSDDSNFLNDTVDIANVSLDSSDCHSSPGVNSKIDHSANNGQTIVPQYLIEFFISMADPGAKSIGVEIPRYCAFSFPAVVLTLGRENWPLLKDAYEELAYAREFRVRRTVASSIHELAMILGEELAGRDLLPVYYGFIKDLDEVRVGALKHLTTFLKILRPADRQKFLPKLKAFLTMDSEWNWRFREIVVSKLLEAIPLFSPNDVSEQIVPLSLPLLDDTVAAVRHTALALATEIISYLSTDEHLVTALIQNLKYLLASEESKWTCRQAFALLCSSLIRNEAISPEIFGRDLLPCLLSLSSDIVPNVRLAVVTALTRHVVNICDYLGADQAEKVNQKIIQMRTDPDRDVRIVAGGVGGKYYPQGAEWKVPAVKAKFSCYDGST